MEVGGFWPFKQDSEGGIFKMLLLLLVDDAIVFCKPDMEQLHYLHHLLICLDAVWDRVNI